MSEAPHVPAAFINAIAEEGTKGEAIDWLQKTWNENCALRAEIKSLREQEPVAWRVDGKRGHRSEVWFYWKSEWPTMHEEHGDKVTPLYASPVRR